MGVINSKENIQAVEKLSVSAFCRYNNNENNNNYYYKQFYFNYFIYLFFKHN